MHRLVLLVGLFRDELFSYARAIYVPSVGLSVAIRRIGEELACIETLDRSYTVDIPEVGRWVIEAICRVDKAVIQGVEVVKRVVLHIGTPIDEKTHEFDMVIGSDLAYAWDLERVMQRIESSYAVSLGSCSSRLVEVL